LDLFFAHSDTFKNIIDFVPVSAASKILLSSNFEKTGTTPKVLLLWAPPYLKNIHVLLYQGCTSLERTHNNLKRKRLN
jgi:hypothetical protein